MPLIQVENLNFTYNAGTAFEKKALTDINFSIERGEFIGIIGQTGSGKSTLIMHLNALMKPTSGRVLLDGADINADKSKLKEIRRRVGIVFQYPERQLFELTVKKDAAFGPRNMGLDEAETETRVREALLSAGIPEALFEKSPFEISGGQKRRAAIAGVLAMKPEVLILDEPAAGLDPKGRDDILSEIKRMRDELNLTVILVSHSMEDIGKLVERILVINDGRIAMTGPPGEIFKNAARLEEIGLAAPQSTYLINELIKRKLYPESADTVYTVDAAISAIESVLKGNHDDFNPNHDRAVLPG